MNHTLRFFEYEHLPEKLQRVSKPFHDLAHEMHTAWIDGKVNGVEGAVALRKLLEAKDAAVRSVL